MRSNLWSIREKTSAMASVAFQVTRGSPLSQNEILLAVMVPYGKQHNYGKYGDLLEKYGKYGHLSGDTLW